MIGFQRSTAADSSPGRVVIGFLGAAALLAALGFGGLLGPGLLAQEGGGDEASPLPAEVDQASDGVLARGLERRFDQIKGFEGLSLSVNAGVVTLSGEVLEESDREEALALARRVEGVAQVRDEIEVVVDPRERLRPAIDEALERLRVLVSYLPLLGVAIVLVFLFFLLSRLAGRWTGLFDRLTKNPFARDLLRQGVQVAILLAGILVALEILDATALVGAVLGTAGVIGLAVGFAFRDLVENYISSILLSIRQPFAPNDHVTVDGQEGKVVRLTSRATILMTMDGNHLRIPNSQVFKGIVLNYTRNPRRRFDVGVGIGVGEDLVAAQQLGIEALEAMPGVLDDPPPKAVIEELGDSNVLVRFLGWVDQREASFTKVQSEAIRQLKTTLEGAGMDLPEPIYRVHLIQPGEAPAHEPPEPRGVPAPDPATDIEPEDDLERQIEEDRAEAGTAADLLSPQGPSE